MKQINFLMSFVVLGLLFFSFPVLAMKPSTMKQSNDDSKSMAVKKKTPQQQDQEYQEGRPLTLRIQKPSSGEIFHCSLPFDIGRKIADSIMLDPNRFYLHMAAPYEDMADMMAASYGDNERQWKRQKSAALNLRGVCKFWKDAVQPVFREIPISWDMSSQQEAPYPSLVSVIHMNIADKDFQKQCQLLYNPNSLFKNLVNFDFTYFDIEALSAISANLPKFRFFENEESTEDDLKKKIKKITGDDIKGLNSTLKACAQNVRYLSLGFSLTTEEMGRKIIEILPILQKLEMIYIDLSGINNEDRVKIIENLPLGIKKIGLQNAHGDLEWKATANVLPRLTNLNTVFFAGSKERDQHLKRHKFFSGKIHRQELSKQSGAITKGTCKKFKEVIKQHPIKDISYWAYGF